MKWTDLLARLPLPMLALAAAYGVYEFQLLFVPVWVAFISAAAFEVTYIALAFVATPDPRRATAISVAAVLVSVAYNTLAALFTRRPGLLIEPPLWGDALLAVLHGLPLAVVAYNVSALLLHARSTPRTEAAEMQRITQAVQVNVAAMPQLPSTLAAYIRARAAELPQHTPPALAAELGTSADTVRRALAEDTGRLKLAAPEGEER